MVLQIIDIFWAYIILGLGLVGALMVAIVLISKISPDKPQTPSPTSPTIQTSPVAQLPTTARIPSDLFYWLGEDTKRLLDRIKQARIPSDIFYWLGVTIILLSLLSLALSIQLLVLLRSTPLAIIAALLNIAIVFIGGIAWIYVGVMAKRVNLIFEALKHKE